VSERLSIALLSHLASPQAPTGAERSLALLAGGLRVRGHRVAVVAPGRWALAGSLEDRGVEVETVPSRSCWMTYWEPRPWLVALAKWGRCLWPQRAKSRLGDYLRRWRPDVVHVNCLPHLAGAAAGAGTGRPVVWHLREIMPAGPRRRWLAGRLDRHASAVVAVSEAVARWVREEGLGDRLHVIPNGVEPLAAPPDARGARTALGLEQGGVVIGLFGQLVPHKGALAFIEAACAAAPSRPDLRFVLAGTGPAAFRRQCERAIAVSGRADRIRLLPAQPSGEPLIAASDVVCLATTTPDPFPRAVLEAMAAGRPVAAFDSGGTAEMLVDGETGLLVPCGDVAALADAFRRLAGDRSLRDAMGTAGAVRARERFSLDLHVSRMEALFSNLSGEAIHA
jgi:glycosyltransferase involved in cell wall biosynthesis